MILSFTLSHVLVIVLFDQNYNFCATELSVVMFYAGAADRSVVVVFNRCIPRKKTIKINVRDDV